MDRRAELTALLEEVRAAILDAKTPDMSGRTQPSAVAALSREARALLDELERLAEPEKGSKVDELRKRREEREGARVAATDPPKPARRSQPRRSNGHHRAG